MDAYDDYKDHQENSYMSIENSLLGDEVFPDRFCRELLRKCLQYGRFWHLIKSISGQVGEIPC